MSAILATRSMVRNLIAHFAELPVGVDPRSERGEFHTFCYRCPEFSTDIPVTVCEVLERDGAEGPPTTDLSSSRKYSQ
jgi:diphthamide synthase (EF-2-diphthine--ammonia ligase)